MFASMTVNNIEAQTSTEQNETSATDGQVKQLRYEIAIYGSIGMSALGYSLDKDGRRSSAGNNISDIIGTAFTWNISEHIGIVTGIERTKYGAKAAYNGISGEKIHGTDIHRFKFQYLMTGYVEEHYITLLSIPVMVQYSVPLTHSIKYYLSGGFKLGLPTKNKAVILSNTLNTSGYYYFENQTYTSLPQYGFVSESSPKSTETDIDVNALLTASVETGTRFSIFNNTLLYTGIYFDYGLNDIRATKDRQIIEYQKFNPPILKYGSILNTTNVDKMKIWNAGVKLQLSFGW
jgi:hypothetical protein